MLARLPCAERLPTWTVHFAMIGSDVTPPLKRLGHTHSLQSLGFYTSLVRSSSDRTPAGLLEIYWEDGCLAPPCACAFTPLCQGKLSDMFLRQRFRQPELMDTPDLCSRQHHAALAGLRRINALSRSEYGYFRPLCQLQRELGRDRLRIVDVACGGGDVTVRLWRLAARHQLDWRISGCDFSPQAVEIARQYARRCQALVHFFTHDLLAAPIPFPVDAVVCSLFLHHLDEEPAVRLLHALRRTGARLLLVNDLDRSVLGWTLALVVPRLVSLSPIVHVDALRSVRAAFRPAEALQLAQQAGWTEVTVRRCWPCRWLLIGRQACSP